MDAGIGTWTRRGIGFGIGVLTVAAVVAGLFVTAKLVAVVMISILLASALAPLVDRLRPIRPGQGPAAPAAQVTGPDARMTGWTRRVTDRAVTVA